MEDVTFCTEAEVKAILLNVIKPIDEAPVVFVAYRNQPVDSLKRTVTFVIQTKEGNEALVDAINKESLVHDSQFWFLKSDMNIQDNNFAVDYLYVDALISPNLS